jgi:hypothetical protein
MRLKSCLDATHQLEPEAVDDEELRLGELRYYGPTASASASRLRPIVTVSTQPPQVGWPRKVCPETLEVLAKNGIEAEVLQTEAAVERFNELRESMPVGGLFHSTC